MAVKPPDLEGFHHTSKGLINEVERVAQDRTRSRAIGEVAARSGSRLVPLRPGSWQLLGCRDALEIHAKYRRRSGVTGAIVAMPVDPVDDGLNFIGVVLLGKEVVRSPIMLIRVRGSGRNCAA